MSTNKYQLYTSVTFSVKGAENELKQMENNLNAISTEYREAVKNAKELKKTMGEHAKETQEAYNKANNLQKAMLSLKTAIGLGSNEINTLKEGLTKMDSTGPRQVTRLISILSKAMKNVSGSTAEAQEKLQGLSVSLGMIKARMEGLQNGFYSILKPLTPISEMTTVQLQGMISTFQKVGPNLSKNSKEYKEMGKNVTEARIRLAEYEGTIERVNERMSPEAAARNISFWKQIAGSAEASRKQVKTANEEISKTQEMMMGRSMSGLGSVQKMGTQSQGEIAANINALREYGKQTKLTKEKREELNAAIERGEQYLARQGQKDEAARMVRQLGEGYANVTKLTDGAMVSQVRFWQNVKNSAVSTKEDVRQAEEMLKGLADGFAGTRSGRVLERADMYGQADIKKAIESARMLQSTIKDTTAWQRMEAAIQKGTARLREMENTGRSMSLGREFENVTKAEQKAQENLFGKMMQPSAEGIERLIRDYQELIGMEERAGRSTEEYKAKVETLNGILKKRRAEEAKQLVNNPLTGTQEEVKKAMQMYEDLARKQQAAGNTEAWEKMRGEIDAANRKLVEYDRQAKTMSMTGQLRQNTDMMSGMIRLTDQALAEQKKFWTDEMMMNREAGAEYEAAKGRLRAVNQEIERRGQLTKQLQEAETQEKATRLMDSYGWSGSGTDSVEKIKENIKLLQKYREQLSPTTGQNIFTRVDETIRKMSSDLRLVSDRTLEARQYMENMDRGGTFSGTVEDLDRIKRSLEEYKRTLNTTDSANIKKVNDALADIDRKQKAVNKETVDWKEMMKNLNTATYKQLKTAAAQLREELENTSRTQKDYNEKAMALRDIDRQVKLLNNDYKSHNGALDGAVSRIKSYVMVYMGFQKIISTIRNMVNGTVELSDLMTNVQKVTGMTTGEINKMTDALQGLDTRLTTEQLMNMAEQAGKLGLAMKGGTDAIVSFVSVGQKIYATLGEDIGGAEAIADLLKINDLVNKGTTETLEKQMERVGSAILDVGNKSKASYADIVNFTRRVGAVGSVAGLTMPEIVALGGTYSALGASIEQSATAVNRMMIGLTTKTDEIAEAARVSVGSLREMVSEGDTFKALQKVIQGISGEGMPGVQRVLRAIGGRVNAQLSSALSLLVSNMDVLNSELNYATNGYGQAVTLTYEFDKANENLAGTLKRIGNEIKEAFVNSKFTEIVHGIVTAIYDMMVWGKKSSLGFGVLTTGVMVLTKGLWAGSQAWMAYQRKAWNATVATTKALMAAITMARQMHGTMFAIKGTATSIMTLIGTGLKNLFVGIGKSIKAFLASNWITLAISLIAGLVTWIARSINEVNALDEQIGNLQNDIIKAQNQADTMFGTLAGSNVKVKEANRQYKEAKEALDGLAGSMGITTEQLREQTDKTEEQVEAIRRADDAEEKLQETQAEKSAVINEINNKYGSYLGYMLSEADSANLVAAAHERIVAALKDEVYQKALSGMKDSVTDRFKDSLQKAYSELRKYVTDRMGFAGREDEFMADATSIINRTVAANPDMTTGDKMGTVMNELKKKYGYRADGNTDPYFNNIRQVLNDYMNVFISMDREMKNMETTYGVFRESADREKKRTQKGYSEALWREIQTLVAIGENRSTEDNDRLVSRLQAYIRDNKDSRNRALKGNVEAARTQLRQVEILRKQGLEKTVWGNQGAKEMARMTGEQLAELYDKLEKAATSTAEGAEYQEIFPEFAQLMQGKDMEEAISTLRDYAEKVKKEMERRGMTHQAKFKWTADGGAESEMDKSMKALRDQVKNDFDAYYKRLEGELADEYLDGRLANEEVYAQKLEQIKQERLAAQAEMNKALLGEKNTFDADMYENIGTGKIVRLAAYISGDGRGRELRDNLRKERDEAVAQMKQASVEVKTEIEKILSENNPFDRMVAQFTSSLINLRILIKEGEVETLKESGKMKEIAERRSAFLLEQSRDSYLLTIESMKKRMKEAGLGDWLNRLTDDELQATINKMQGFYDEYEEAFRKTTDRLNKLMGMKWKQTEMREKMGRDGKQGDSMYSMLTESISRAEDRMKMAQKAEEWGYGGESLPGVKMSDEVEIDVTRRQIDMGMAYIEMINMEMEARRKAVDEQLETDLLSAKSTEKRVALEKKASEEKNMLIRQQETLTGEKMQEVNELIKKMSEQQVDRYASVIGRLEPYKDALVAFGESMGEAAFGSKEDRENASRELVNTVIKTTGNILTQWLVMLATRKIIGEQEVLMEQYKEAKITAAYLQAEAVRLQTAEAFMAAQLAMSEAEGIGKEVARAGLIGFAIGAAITVAMSALMAVTMGAVNKAKSEVASASGSASRMKTGMLTYAEGRYPVMGQDGKIYDAEVTDGMKTGIYRGAHVGIFSEKRPEAVIDGSTTEKLILNYPGIWKDIVSLSKNGGLSPNSSYGNRRTAVITSRTGGSTGSAVAAGGGSSAEITATLAALTATMGALQGQLEKGIGVTIPMFGDGSLNKAIGKMNRFQKRNGL